MTVDWRTLTPQQVLDIFPALTVSQVAYVIPSCYTRKSDPTKSRPVRRKAIDLIRSGAIWLVDPKAPLVRWCVTSDEVRRYLTEGPRNQLQDGLPSRAWHLGDLDLTRPFGIVRPELPPDAPEVQ